MSKEELKSWQELKHRTKSIVMKDDEDIKLH